MDKKLDYVVDVSRAFEDVLLEQVICVWSRKRLHSEYYRTSSFVEGYLGELIRVSTEYSKLSDTLIIGPSREELRVFRKMISPGISLGDVSTTMRGLPFQRYLENEGDYPVFRGDHIGRFQLFETDEFLGEERIDLDKDKVRMLLRPKIISQRIVAHVSTPSDHIIIMSTVDPEGRLTVDTVENTILKNDKYSLYFICSLLNSKLISWFAYLFIFSKAIRTMDFDNYYVSKIPLPSVRFDALTSNQREVLRNIEDLCEKKSWGEVLDLAEEVRRAWQRQQDEARKNPRITHDILAYLGKSMVEMNRQRQNQTESFFTDLEGIVDEKIFKSLQKGKQGRSLYKRKSCRAYVEKGSYTTYQLDAALTWSHKAFKDFVKLLARKVPNLSDIMSVYDKYHPELKELQERIDKTDELIDQIVYRLYGLTDEEIRIVEESFGRRGE